MARTEHHYVEFSEKRLAFFRKLKPGQDWRHLSEEDQKAALSEAARNAAGGKTGFFRRLAWDRPCPTLVTMPNMPATALCHPAELRPLSIEEYKRIQGLLDDWKLCGTLPDQYRQVGNAVPVLLGKAIGKTIVEHMRTQESEAPVPGFRYSRYAGTSDREWGGRTNSSRARRAGLAAVSACRRSDELVQEQEEDK
jgi:DNA (cytosine-5)-methyltransferase 1